MERRGFHETVVADKRAATAASGFGESFGARQRTRARRSQRNRSRRNGLAGFLRYTYGFGRAICGPAFPSFDCRTDGCPRDRFQLRIFPGELMLEGCRPELRGV